MKYLCIVLFVVGACAYESVPEKKEYSVKKTEYSYEKKTGNKGKEEGYGKSVSYGKSDGYGKDQGHSQGASYQGLYHGKYNGKCGNDGFYYKDGGSFVICSNNNAYEQPCAPGSRNSGYDNYAYGGSYSYRDFCDINLVDQGYGAKFGYGGNKGGYGGNQGGYGRNQGGYGGYNRGYDAGYNSGYRGGYQPRGGYRNDFHGAPGYPGNY